tara:strand:- start:2486 stop:3814 length:1329 start_codon:yes stop_codon:yes gene_type:complete
MAQQISSKSAEPTNVEQIDILSNIDPSKTVSVINSFAGMTYTESIMSDTVKVSVSFVDSGDSIDDKSVTEGLPLVGQEQVKLKFSDNNDNTLEPILYVNKINPIADRTQDSLMSLELVSKEFILNEKIRVNQRFDGKVSDHINKLLTDSKYLGTDKNVDIEQTSNLYNFFGNNKKPFYTTTWLCNKSVSEKNQTLGKSAGYFFYETSEGFFFKSIDGLLDQEPKLKLIYNETPDVNNTIPEGYDQKILNFKKDNDTNVQKKLQMGAFSSRTVLFDPFTCYYEVKAPKAEDNEDQLKMGGKDLYLGKTFRNKEFDREGTNEEFSRTTYFLLDKGTAPAGNSDQQLEKSGEENFEYGQIANQSLMRYNQMYSARASITIAGNFSLHAGDAIFIDSPGLEKQKTSEVDRKDGGLYIITDICHQITSEGTFTQCNLARDSFGRKPK